MDDIKRYYAERAPEYEDIYALPERQESVARLRSTLAALLAGHDVLEVACGTGFWTQPISLSARSILATDVNEEVLQVARAKEYPRHNVSFQLADALEPSAVQGRFTAGFAGFWWSHMPRAQAGMFLERFHAKLGAGALVVIVDNLYVPGQSSPVESTDEEGNTYQLRKLKNGHEFRVLKNYWSEEALRSQLEGIATGVEYRPMEYYWCLSYRVRSS